MLMNNILGGIKKSIALKKYPTADRNAHPLRLAWQAVPYYFSRTGFSFPPVSVFIHVNSTCNLRCKMCDAGQENTESMFYKNLRGNAEGDMPLEHFKAIIDKVAHFKPFIGSPVLEPLIHPQITDMVRYVRSAGLRMSVATNATMLESLAEELVDAELTKLIISLDGPEAEHDEIRGVHGVFRKVLQGLEALDREKKRRGSRYPLVYLNYVISEINDHTVERFMESIPLDLVHQVDFRVMFFCPEDVAERHNEVWGDRYDATSACLEGGLDPSAVNTDELHRQLTNVLRAYPEKCRFFFNHGKEGLRTYYKQPDVFLDDTCCVFPWYTLQINHDCSVIPPQRCYHQRFGNILEQDFQDIWNGPAMRRFRMDLRKHGRLPACTRCEGVNY